MATNARRSVSRSAGRNNILTEDLDAGHLVVIELKRESGKGDEVVGQTSRYVGWVRKNLAKPGQEVLGIICVHDIPEKLRFAAEEAGLELMTYQFSFGRG